MTTAGNFAYNIAALRTISSWVMSPSTAGQRPEFFFHVNDLIVSASAHLNLNGLNLYISIYGIQTLWRVHHASNLRRCGR